MKTTRNRNLEIPKYDPLSFMWSKRSFLGYGAHEPEKLERGFHKTVGPREGSQFRDKYQRKVRLADLGMVPMGRHADVIWNVTHCPPFYSDESLRCA